MNSRASKDIAIIGMSCQVAEAETPRQYWDALIGGKSLVKTFTEDQLLAGGVSARTIAHPNFIPASATLKSIETFDYRFFEYSLNEAKFIDPQIRLFLNCAWEALEDSGYNPNGYEGQVGVFGGSFYSDYLMRNLIGQVHEKMGSEDHFYAVYQNISDYLSSVVSYKLNLKGPCVSVQSWCTTSLSAVHVACKSLLAEDCDMALAGGVQINVPQLGTFFKDDGTISRSGVVRTFDQQADGIVNGAGAGVMILKRLDHAVRDGDNIHAVIKGSALYNEGRVDQKLSYHGVTVGGQCKAMEKAYQAAGVSPGSVRYVEVHGGSNSLLDRLEVQALEKFYAPHANPGQLIALGSNKPNVGSLGPASGVTGLIKLVLALKHGQMPGQINLQTPNKRLFSANSPFCLVRENQSWPAGETPRRASLNAYGVGGNYAHFVLEEAPAQRPTPDTAAAYLLALSAKSRTALRAQCRNLLAFLEENHHASLSDVSFTLNTGKVAFPCREALVCENVADAVRQLAARCARPGTDQPPDRNAAPVVFVFSGFGEQQVNMGKGLYETIPYFRDQINRCAALFRQELHVDILDVLYPATPEATGEARQRIFEVEYGSPCLFTYQYALAQTLMHLGIVPARMLGFSLGESVAACIAGVLTLPEMVGYLANIVRAVKSGPGGRMLIVAAPRHTVERLVGEDVQVAGVYHAESYLLSGSVAGMTQLEGQLTAEALPFTPFKSAHPLHSSHLAPASRELLERIRHLPFKPARIPYLSGVSGTWITNEQAQSPAYWAGNLVQPVQFEAGLREVFPVPGQTIIKFGPNTTTARFGLTRDLFARNNQVLNFSPVNAGGGPAAGNEYRQFLNVVSRVWANGAPLDWSLLYQENQPRRVSLPTYPFEPEPCWEEALPPAAPPVGNGAGQPPAPAEEAPAPGALPTRERLEGEIQRMWEALLGNPAVPTDEHFIGLGGTSLSCMMFLNKLHGTYKNARLTLSDVFGLGTIANIAAHLEAELQQVNSLEKLSENPAERHRQFIEYITGRCGDEQLRACAGQGEVDEQVRDLMYEINRDFELVLYDHEVLACAGVEAMARLLEKNLFKADPAPVPGGAGPAFSKSYSWVPREISYAEGEQLEDDIIFVVSAQRSGSTLLRLMLGGNPKLVCPPELGILIYPDLHDWKELYCRTRVNEDGLVSLIRELHGVDGQTARETVYQWVGQKLPVKELFRYIQSRLGDKILVDKTPDYAYDIRSLYKAEKLFKKARYIFLHRHPYSVIDSFVKARFDKLAGFDGDSPHAVAEDVWYQSNRNLLEFSERVEPSRMMRIGYEDLVMHPLKTMQKLCDALQIPFDWNMTQPYKDRKMLVGPGDPNIFNHASIEPGLAHVWKSIRLPAPLREESQAMAAALGYELPA